MKFIVKLFPEIMIKSKPVRQRQVKQLRQNLHTILKRDFEGVKVRGFWDKVEVRADDECSADVAEALQRIPGIANILRVKQYHIDDIDNNFDAIVAHTIAALGESLAGKTFVVRIKRAGKHTFTSHELERYVGGGLLEQTEAKGVDLHDPEVTVKLEVRDEDLYVVEQRYEGLGGYPVGTQDAVLSLISGGFDSTVSSYLTMKRGLKTHYCFFNLGGSAHEIGVKQVSLYLWERYGSSHRVKFITVPFEEVVAEILRTVHHSQMGVVLKRMMLRAATEVAEQMGIEALVTGESVAQVSSQTLTNLNVIDRATDMLVLRPLVTMDKQDIISLSAQIGTEDFAKTMPEYCGVISDRPTTAAKFDRVLAEEENFNFGVLESAISTRRSIKIDQVLESQMSVAEVEVVSVPSVSDVVIDIRHPDEAEKKPLMLTNNVIEKIAFFDLMSRVDSLSADKNYLLYCEHGSMSQLHASHLKTIGYENIKVYQPVE
jgi:thiamine biosynthesis protein ThiI